jgi:hypothetical protein
MIAINPKINMAHLMRLCKMSTEFIIFILGKFRQIVGQFDNVGIGDWRFGIRNWGIGIK